MSSALHDVLLPFQEVRVGCAVKKKHSKLTIIPFSVFEVYIGELFLKLRGLCRRIIARELLLENY